MAEINLGNDETINATLSTEEPITSEVLDINYIPGYVVAEQERRANEIVRQSNEANRIALYEDMENKLATGYFDGDPGNGISSIEKTSTSGLVDTYTITFDDGTTETYTITNGKDGEDGATGQAGADAKINGVNTLSIEAGENININQSGSTMTISSTGGGATYTAGTGIEITSGNVINNTSPSKIITINADPQTMQLEKNADEINEYLNNGYIVMALGYQVFRKDYNSSTHTIQLAIYFGAFGQVITVTGNQVTDVDEYYYASDYNYVHTDNNFSYYYKDKLDNAPEVVNLSNYSVGDTISDTAVVSKLMNDSCKIKYGGTIYSFATTIGTGYIYTVMNSLTAGAYITLNYNSGSNTFYFYEVGTAPWESPSNKVQNLNTPTTETYPSTLAVYNAINNAITNTLGGSY